MCSWRPHTHWRPRKGRGPSQGWDTQINSPGRFRVLEGFANAAVLDKETGLVWEQSPETIGFNWLDAQSHCNNQNVGGRFGWRLPTLQELASFRDPTQSYPALPSGHPFSNVGATTYWSATTSASDSDVAWIVHIAIGGAGYGDKSLAFPAWCVRGGQGVDAQ